MNGSANMGLPATFRLTFVSTNGAIHSQPREWVPYTLVVDISPEIWREINLSVNGIGYPVYLQQLDGRDVVCVDWARAGAGNYRIQARWPGGSCDEWFSIPPGKLTAGAFETLIQDLHRHLPLDVAISFKRAGGLVGFDLPSRSEYTLDAEIARIQRALNGTNHRIGLIQILDNISADPHRTLVAKTQWTPRWRSRRPAPGGLPRAIAKPGNLMRQNKPVQVEDGYVEHSVDTRENQILKLYVQQVRQRLNYLLREVRNRNISAHTTVLSLDWHFQRVIRRAAFLGAVRDLHQSPSTVSMVLARQPNYQAMYQGFLEFRRSPFVRLKSRDLSAPLDNLPSLYQTWGTLSVTAALIDHLSDRGFRLVHQRLIDRDATGLYIELLPRDQPIAELYRDGDYIVVRVWSEPTISAKGHRWRSVSYDQRPDLVVEISRAAEGPSQLLIFDPKYKLRGELMTEEDSSDGPPDALTPIKADIDKMHAYRDAIRDSDGNRLVAYAATLYPGQTREFGDDITAISAVPGNAPYLRHVLHRVFERFIR